MPLIHAQDVPGRVSRIGLIAGQGDFPLLLARAARANGVEVTAFGIKGFASEEIEQAADKTIWFELGQLGRLIDLLHENKLNAVAMVGRVPHTSVLQYRHFDVRAVKLLAKAINKKPDSLLGAVTRELESENIQVLDSTVFLKSFMPEPGLLTPGRPPTGQEIEDIEFGYPIAKAVAGQDIGQTIVVREQMVIAVEGVEGTDECVRRAGELAGAGCVVIKVSKPAQDARFDVPVIGRRTIEVMQESGCSALALSARECLIFDREAVLAAAQQAGIAVVAR
jgi:UDP-2,3-diacylglucosamine hydrolase